MGCTAKSHADLSSRPNRNSTDIGSRMRSTRQSDRKTPELDSRVMKFSSSLIYMALAVEREKTVSAMTTKVPSSSVRRGILSLPGADAASKSTLERLLKKDHAEHHCYFKTGFHNHLLHHIFAAYDLGASASLLQAIFDDEVTIQRPIDLREDGVVPEGIIRRGEINEDNWSKWLGNELAYSAYVEFFSGRIAVLGIVKTLEDYIFSPTANDNSSYMLFRLFSGVLHPFIHIGYGLEFDVELQVAAGLASTAVHPAREETYVHERLSDSDLSGTQPIKADGPTSVLSLLRQIYDSPKLTPVLPRYNPMVTVLPRVRDLIERDGGSRMTELKRIMSYFNAGETDQEFNNRVEEFVFASTLLTFGTGRTNRKPRIDFFLMHLLTSSLFLPSFFKYIPKAENKKALLETFLQPWGTILLIRGRPRIDPNLLMSYASHPLPPSILQVNAHSSSIGGNNIQNINPWSAIIADAIHAPDSHTLKSLRTLLYGAMKYGVVQEGSVIGAFGADGRETHPGIGKVDGTIFVRAAGVLIDSLGWTTHGQEAGVWDRSGLGWDDAWAEKD